MKKIKYYISTEHTTCGEPGCCDAYIDTAYVTMDNGEEFEVDVSVDKEDMYAMILAKLGYGVEEEH